MATAAAGRHDDDDDISTSSDEEAKTRHKVRKFFKSITDDLLRDDLQRSQIQQALKLANEAYLAAASERPQIYQFIESTHQGQQNGHTDLTKFILQDGYQEIKQSATESIHFFYERFLATLRALESNKYKIPKRQDQAIHFLR